jgi:hypothetical protein
MKNLLLYAFAVLMLTSSCKKEEDAQPTLPTEPQSEEITSLKNTNWFRDYPDNMHTHIDADTLYFIIGGLSYVHTYSYSDYKITYQWIATDSAGIRMPPKYTNPVRVAKVKLLKNELYFWNDFEIRPWGDVTTYSIGVKQN